MGLVRIALSLAFTSVITFYLGYPQMPSIVSLELLPNSLTSIEFISEISKLAPPVLTSDNIGSIGEFSEMRALGSPIQSVAWSNRHIVALTSGKDITFYNYQTREWANTIRSDRSIRLSLFSDDGRFIYVLNSLIYRVDPEGEIPNQLLLGHNSQIADFVISNSKSWLLSTDISGKSIIWDLDTNRIIYQVESTRISPRAITLDSSSNQAFICDSMGDIYIWDPLYQGGYQKTGMQHQDCTSLSIPRNGELLFSSGESGNVIIWSISQRAFVKEIKTRAGAIRQLQSSNNGDWVALSGFTGLVAIINASTLEIASQDLVHLGMVGGIALSPEGDQILSGGSDGKLQIRKLSNLELVSALLSPIGLRTDDNSDLDMQFNLDGTVLFARKTRLFSLNPVDLLQNAKALPAGTPRASYYSTNVDNTFLEITNSSITRLVVEGDIFIREQSLEIPDDTRWLRYCLSSDRKTLYGISYNNDGRASIYAIPVFDLSNYKRYQYKAVRSSWATDVEYFVYHGKPALAISGNTGIYLYIIGERKAERIIASSIRELDVMPSGELLSYTTQTNVISVINLLTSTVVLEASGNAPMLLSQGDVLAYINPSKNIIFQSLASGDILSSIKDGKYLRLLLSPSGNIIVGYQENGIVATFGIIQSSE